MCVGRPNTNAEEGVASASWRRRTLPGKTSSSSGPRGTWSICRISPPSFRRSDRSRPPRKNSERTTSSFRALPPHRRRRRRIRRPRPRPPHESSSLSSLEGRGSNAPEVDIARSRIRLSSPGMRKRAARAGPDVSPRSTSRRRRRRRRRHGQ